MAYDKPLIEHPTYNTREWWAATKEHRLLYQRCRQCGTHTFPPRDVCPGPDCLAFKDLEWVESSGKGRIFSFTILHQPQDMRFQADGPHLFAIIELDEHWRMYSNITNLPNDEVRVGQRVEVDWEDVTDEVSLPKFKVVDK